MDQDGHRQPWALPHALLRRKTALQCPHPLLWPGPTNNGGSEIDRMLSPCIETLIWPNLEAQGGAGLHPTLPTGTTLGKTPIFHLFAAVSLVPPVPLQLFLLLFPPYIHLPPSPPPALAPGSAGTAQLLCPALQGNPAPASSQERGLVLHKVSVDPELNIHSLTWREPQNTADFRGKGKKMHIFHWGYSFPKFQAFNANVKTLAQQK